MSKSEVNSLFNDFLNHPKLVFSANNTGCESKADLMAEIAHQKGHEVSKIWVRPMNSTDNFPVYLNEAKTESTVWNYHVAIQVKMKTSSGTETMIIDPSLFDEPVTMDTWSKRISSLSDEYDYDLEFKESSREAFFGPEDMVTRETRARALAKRDDILSNSGNLNDPVVRDGYLMKLRGQYVDDLMKKNPQDFETLEELLLNQKFNMWFKTPLQIEQIKQLLDQKPRFYGIKSSDIKSKIDFSSPDASFELKKYFWKKIGKAFERLSSKSEELLNGPFNTTTQPFRYQWESASFRGKWFSPAGDEEWVKYGLNPDTISD
ncbi:MAG: hypothetical protein EP319_11625 [Deltaproteobacteria bacterium]|nr:MAG: hypothetical protein EP319_11625 [Deltaproteobacteria bacterium]